MLRTTKPRVDTYIAHIYTFENMRTVRSRWGAYSACRLLTLRLALRTAGTKIRRSLGTALLRIQTGWGQLRGIHIMAA